MIPYRERILQAVMAAVNTDRPAGVPELVRSRIVGISADEHPCQMLYPVKEDVERVGSQARRTFTFRVECIASDLVGAGVPLDALLNDMLAWLTQALAGSKLGGLAQDTQELGTEWQLEAGEVAVAQAVVDFAVRYTTPINDQVSR